MQKDALRSTVAYVEHKGLHEGGGGLPMKLLGKLTGWAIPNGYWDFPRATKESASIPIPRRSRK